MARDWVEREHPRHPGGSDRGGRFRERVGGGGWAMRLASQLGQRRSPGSAARERGVQPRAGTFIGNVPETHGNARPVDVPPRSEHEVTGAELIDSGRYTPGDWEVYNEDTGEWEIFQGGESSGAGRGGVEHVTGFVDTPSGGFHIPAEPDPEDFEDGEDDEDYDQALQSWERFGDLRVRPRSGAPEADLDAAEERNRRDLLDEANAEFGGEAELEASFAEAGRQLAEGGNLPRLTNQEVAQALAPTEKVSMTDEYGRRITPEALAQRDVRGMDRPTLVAHEQRLSIAMMRATGLTLTRLRGQAAMVRSRLRSMGE